MNTSQRQSSGSAAYGRTGRRIGIGLFWFMAVYVTGSSAHSVISELFVTKTGPGNPSVCANNLSSLHASLLAHASDELRSAGDAPAQRAWLTDWDREFANTDATCAALNSTRRTLRSLREQVETMLRNHARRALPLSESIEHDLQRYLQQSIPPRKT